MDAMNAILQPASINHPFPTTARLVNVEVDQVAPAAPVPYVGKDPRFYFDIEAMSRPPPRPEPRPNDLPEGVERPKGIGCIVDVAIFLRRPS